MPGKEFWNNQIDDALKTYNKLRTSAKAISFEILKRKDNLTGNLNLKRWNASNAVKFRGMAEDKLTRSPANPHKQQEINSRN